VAVLCSQYRGLLISSATKVVRTKSKFGPAEMRRVVLKLRRELGRRPSQQEIGVELGYDPLNKRAHSSVSKALHTFPAIRKAYKAALTEPL
jgi:hypothetical protein